MPDFSEPAEYADLRAAVREITAAHGPAEYAEHGRAGEPMTGLWTDLGKAGFIGINVPEEYGGGGAGMSELAMVAEESAAGGCPLLTLLVSSAISVEILRRHGSAEQQRGVADPTGRRRHEDGLRDHRAGRRQQHPPPADHRTPDGSDPESGDYVISGQKYYISGVDEAAAILTVARTGTDPETGQARLSLFIVPVDAAGLQLDPTRGGGADPGSAVHGVLRRRPGAGVRADRCRERRAGGRCSTGSTPSGSPRPRSVSASPGTPWPPPPSYARSAASGASRSVPTRRWPTRSPQAQIQTELARLMTAKAAWLHDNGLPAGEASNMAKYAAAEAAVAAVDAAIQVHGGNGLSVEYGLLPLWGMARLLRIAPVNSEMMLELRRPAHPGPAALVLTCSPVVRSGKGPQRRGRPTGAAPDRALN